MDGLGFRLSFTLALILGEFAARTSRALNTENNTRLQ